MNSTTPAKYQIPISAELEQLRVKKLKSIENELRIRESQSMQLMKASQFLNESTPQNVLELKACLEKLKSDSEQPEAYFDLIELSKSFTGKRRKMKGGYPIADMLSDFNISHLSSRQAEVLYRCTRALLMHIKLEIDLLKKFNGGKGDYFFVHDALSPQHKEVLTRSIIATAYISHPFVKSTLVDGIYIAIDLQDKGLDPFSDVFPKIDKEKLSGFYFFSNNY